MQELQEMWVRFLGQEDFLKEGMTKHSRTPWTEEPCGLRSIGQQKLDMTEATWLAQTQGAKDLKELGSWHEWLRKVIREFWC